MDGHDIQAADLAAVVRDLAASVRDPADATLAVDDALRSAADALGAAGAGVFLVVDAEGHLAPAAACGPHAAFVKDIAPTDLEDGENEVVRVVATGEPLYVADIYPQTQPEQNVDGVARWRSAMVTGSHAVLPLRVGGRTLGALTLQWTEARDFTPDETTLLGCVAGALAAIVDRAGSASSDDACELPRLQPDREETSRGTAAVIAFPRTEPRVVRRRGVVAERTLLAVGPDGVLRDVESLGAEPLAAAFRALEVRVTTPAGASEPLRAAFWDVLRLPERRFGVVFGSAVCGRDESADLAALVSGMVRSALVRGRTASKALDAARRAITPTFGEHTAPLLFVGMMGLDDETFHYHTSGIPAPLLILGTGRVKPLFEKDETTTSVPGVEILMPGDTLLCYTRSLISARRGGTAGVEYGPDRLARTAASLVPLPATKIPETLFNDVDEWTDSWSPDDTILLAATRYAY